MPKPPARARRGFRFWLGILLIVAGLAMAGLFWWDTFGTTMMVRGTHEAEIVEVVESWPQAPEEIVSSDKLLRDFEQFPPPRMEMGTTGDAFGILTIPSWQGLTWRAGVTASAAEGDQLRNRILVRQGGETEAVTNRILNTGAAVHYLDTAGPGDIGNFSLSAHRRSHGDNFLHLPELVEGDWVVLETHSAWYIYRIIGEGQVVLPTDVSVINPDPFSPVDENGMQTPTRRLITLTTCTTPSGGAFGNSHRWIVHGELDSWMPRSYGIPPMIDQYWTEEVS
jgi:sortase A